MDVFLPRLSNKSESKLELELGEGRTEQTPLLDDHQSEGFTIVQDMD